MCHDHVPTLQIHLAVLSGPVGRNLLLHTMCLRLLFLFMLFFNASRRVVRCEGVALPGSRPLFRAQALKALVTFQGRCIDAGLPEQLHFLWDLSGRLCARLLRVVPGCNLGSTAVIYKWHKFGERVVRVNFFASCNVVPTIVQRKQCIGMNVPHLLRNNNFKYIRLRFVTFRSFVAHARVFVSNLDREVRL